MPELREVSLDEIDEPAIAARVCMDDEKMAELMDSMRDIGLLNPITLKRRELRYEIEAGHRRFLAARFLKWSSIRALIYEPGELIEHAAKLAENLCREDLSAADEALWFCELSLEHGWDTDALAHQVRKSRDYVEDRLRLLRDDAEVFSALREHKINFSVARELNKCVDEGQRRYFLQQAIAAQCGARIVAQWVAQHRAMSFSAPPPSPAVEAAPVAEPAPAQFFGCDLCGGDRDPYNLVHVRMHRHEWEKIREAYLAPQS